MCIFLIICAVQFVHGSSEPTTYYYSCGAGHSPLNEKRAQARSRKKNVEPANRQPTIPCNKAETGRLVTSFPGPVAIKQARGHASGARPAGLKTVWCWCLRTARAAVGGGQPERLNDASPGPFHGTATRTP